MVTLIATVINWVYWHITGFLHVDHIYDVFRMIIAVAVLVINVVVVYQVRRSATNAAANLGVQQHHQSTSSNSVVPTVMLIATSLIYVLLYDTAGIFRAIFLHGGVFRSLLNFSDDTLFVGEIFAKVMLGLSALTYVYNFYVYLITGKRFRSELRKLFSCCRPSSSPSSPVTAAAAVAAVIAGDAEVARRAQNDTVRLQTVPQFPGRPAEVVQRF